MYISGFYHQATRADRDIYVDVDFEAIYDYEVAMFINDTKASIKKNYVKCNETSLGKARGCNSLGIYSTLFKLIFRVFLIIIPIHYFIEQF